MALNRVMLMKAEGVAGQQIDDVEIVIGGDGGEIGKVDKWMDGSLSIQERGDFYRSQAISLADALRGSLPAGTIDRLVAILLVSKASHFLAPWGPDLSVEVERLTKERDEALGDGVLSQRVCDIENDRAQLRSDVDRLTQERDIQVALRNASQVYRDLIGVALDELAGGPRMSPLDIDTLKWCIRSGVVESSKRDAQVMAAIERLRSKDQTGGDANQALRKRPRPAAAKKSRRARTR